MSALAILGSPGLFMALEAIAGQNPFTVTSQVVGFHHCLHGDDSLASQNSILP